MKSLILILATGALIVTLLNFRSYNMNNINLFLKNQVDRHQTPSIQYAIFDSESIMYEMQYGLKNVQAKEQVDPSTTYHLYSVTKTFTALAVLQLAQAGKIELNKPVSKYLPQFPYDTDITIEHLLSHTSGIPNPLPLRWIHLQEEHRNFDHDNFFAQVFRDHPKLDFQPGSKFRYTNLGYVILGQLVEAVSGRSFEEYVTENIFRPAGIEQTELGFDITESTHAVGYHKWWSFSNAVFGFLIDKSKFMGDREGKWKPFKKFYNNGKAYGGLIGSPSGLIKYAQSLIKKDSILLNDRYKDILFSETSIDGKPTGMSFAWFTGTVKGHRYYAHAGGGGGYYVELRVYPEQGIGSVICYNRSGMTDERILSKADSFFLTDYAQ